MRVRNHIFAFARAMGLPVCAVLAGALAAPAAEARRVFIDFGPSFENSGNNWDSSNSFEADRTDDGCGGSPCEAISIGFDVNFGSGNLNTLFISENGVVSFGSGLTSFNSQATSLSGLGVPVIAPFYANLISTAPGEDIDSGVTEVLDGEILWSRGVADPQKDGSGNYDENDALPALHVTWNNASVGSTLVLTDLIIYSYGNGDFDISFGYGGDDTATINVPGSRAGFALGSNIHEFTGPYAAATEYYFQFRDGVAVPLPGALPLALTAWAGVFAMGRRRSRRNPA